jgi:hypothetical protein
MADIIAFLRTLPAGGADQPGIYGPYRSMGLVAGTQV